MKRIRLFSLLTAVLLLVTIFASYIFIVEHTQHECIGEDCPICMELEMAAHIVIAFKAVLPVIAILATFLLIVNNYQEHRSDNNISKFTLISLKVELDD